MEAIEKEIPSEEGYLVEFKDFSGGLSAKELAITMCAFANTDGGDMYIGVTDTRGIRGVRVRPAILDIIQNTAREGCSPSIQISLRQIKIDSHKSVIKISIPKSGHLHSTLSGKSYIRVGTQDKTVLGDELLRLAETKSFVSFEEETLDAGIDVIDLDALNEYYEARTRVSVIRKKLSPEELLIKIGLAGKKNGKVKIKTGAFLLFGKQEESLLIQRDFTFVKYDTPGKMYSYREDISLSIAKMLNRLMELIRPLNKITEGVQGLERKERSLYPEDAIREALLNAVAHRDYRILGLRNECRFYPDRLEIISAGSLPSIITLENIDKRHYSRNPKIMHALLIMGLTEELGQGITLMKKALAQNGNPPLLFEASLDQFKVTFFRAQLERRNIDIKKLLEDYFETHETITRAELEMLTGLKRTSSKTFIRKLIDEGYIDKIGDGPSTCYRKHML